jgi:2,4-dienoyl-CoA reductase-like NADH-dependent reductase (Old Yellow Enzyme family)/thioredoxin reductase
MNDFFPELFRPGYIGNLWLRNRIVMAPMATHLAYINGEVSEALIAYYAARARGGVGLVIVEAACVTPFVANEGFGQLYISHPRFVLGLNRLSEAIRANGSRTFIQLFHAGRQTTRLVCGGEQPVAPSAIPCTIMKEMPHELTTLEVKQVINEFIASAHYAHRAGFDGVELHAAHGYLINQFLSPHTNQRSDEYGGSLQNRQRFLLEIVTEIKEVLPELTISVRLNIDDFIQGGLEIEESLEVCQCLEKSGVDIINCSSGTYESGLKSIEPASYEEGWRVYLAEAVKKLVNIPVISGGMIRNPEFANQVLVDKKADFIFLGRSLLADPEWVNKARQNEVADIRPCISCNNCIANGFKGLGMRCTVNPFSGRETMLNQEIQVQKNARVVIVGGGPAGMQAAISLRRQGLRVTLYEKEAELGGFMGLAGIPPHKEQIVALRNYMVRELYKSEAELVLNHEFTSDIIWATKPDVLVLATGSKPVRPTIAGSDQSNCVEAVEVLGRKIEISRQKVVVIGGGSTGCEVADYLLPNNNQVTIIEAGESMAADMERKNRRDLMNRLEEAGVEKRVGARVVEIMPDSVLIEVAGVAERLPVDWVVWATGFKPQNEIFSIVQEEVPFVFLIGDAFKVRGFKEAILEGEMLGNTISGLLK